MPSRHICTAATIVEGAVGKPQVSCGIAGLMRPDPILFPADECYKYEVCSLWRRYKQELWKRQEAL